MNDERAYTGPTGIRLVDGHFHIDGHPDATQLVELKTKLGWRLAVLRLYEADLAFCVSAMQSFGQLRQKDSLAGEAMLTGIVTRFFSCFGQNKAQFKLEPSRVFKGRPDAREAFEHWKAMRDKHITHNESALTRLTPGLALDAKGDVLDVLSLQFSPILSLDNDGTQNLFNLIDHTLKHIRAEIEALLPRVFEEAKKMTPAERQALPSVVYEPPSAEQAKRMRPKSP